MPKDAPPRPSVSGKATIKFDHSLLPRSVSSATPDTITSHLFPNTFFLFSPLILRSYQRSENGASAGTLLQTVSLRARSILLLMYFAKAHFSSHYLGWIVCPARLLIVCALLAFPGASGRSSPFVWQTTDNPEGLRKAVAIPSVSAQDENRKDVFKVGYIIYLFLNAGLI